MQLAADALPEPSFCPHLSYLHLNKQHRFDSGEFWSNSTFIFNIVLCNNRVPTVSGKLNSRLLIPLEVKIKTYFTIRRRRKESNYHNALERSSVVYIFVH